MLSKEEIKNHLEEIMRTLSKENINREDNILGQYVCNLQKVENYIEQLETDKQKLIEKLEEDETKINKKIKDNNKTINKEWLGSGLSMDDYFARKNKLTRENEILEMKIEYLKSFYKILKGEKKC